MTSLITTDADVVRHMIRRVATATGIAMAMTSTIMLMTLGTDPDAQISVGSVAR